MNAQARLGAFVLIGLLVLGLLSSRIGRFQWYEQQGSTMIETLLPNASGIVEQSPVLLAGVAVGKVEHISLERHQALLQLRIFPNINLPASTRAHIAGGGLVGEKYIALTAKIGDKQLLTHKRISSKPESNFSSLMNSASTISQELLTFSQKANTIADTIHATINENRDDIRQATQSFSNTGQQLSKLTQKHQADLDQLLTSLPKASLASVTFFTEAHLAAQDFRELMLDNRENLYRSLYELRKASENLEAFSDDIRRNPWKLMNEKTEVKASQKQRQQKLEEMLLTTGHLGAQP
ncbi:MAG: MlaD family protein [Mariprofundaceae bacterium]